MSELLLDTDILSLFLRNSPKVMTEVGSYLSQHKGLTFSIITDFEIQRGLKVKDARKQISKFEQIRQLCRIINLDEGIIARAADIYADLHCKGSMIGDADILIAATALEQDLPIVTNNESHFSRIVGLQTLNWNQ